MITLKYQFTYHFYEEKTKFISDETLAIKGRLLYLSAILLFLSNVIDFQITSVFGIKFGGNQYIEMLYVIYFLLAATIYNLLSFLHKYSEDRLSQVKIQKNYTTQEKSDAALKNELIKDQLLEFKGIDAYKQPTVIEYKEILDDFIKETDDKIKKYLFEKNQESNFSGLCQSEHEQLNSIGYDAHEKVKQLINKYAVIDKSNTILESIEKNLNETFKNFKTEALDKLTTCLDPEIFRKDIKATEEKFDLSITELKKALENRSVKLKRKVIINFWVPIAFTLLSVLWTICQFLFFYSKSAYDYNFFISNLNLSLIFLG